MKHLKKWLVLELVALAIILLASGFTTNYKDYTIEIALLKYNGGGDWYANPTSLTNLARYCNNKMDTNINPDYPTVEVGSVELYNYPMVHMTGHGNVVFSAGEAENMRNYLMAGGFLHIDDNYGMDPYVRPELKKVFPELDLKEVPFDHPIYHLHHSFKNGLPKIHKHDDKPAKGYGLFWEGRLVCFYSYETDLGDGWEDQSVHKNSEAKRLEALKMGANIVKYAFTD